MTSKLPTLTLCALLAAGNASALPAHRYIDENRVSVVLPGDRSNIIAIHDAPQLLPEEDRRQQPAAAAMAASSAVPEPSGPGMLCCGLVLLLLTPAEHRSALFEIGRRRRQRR